MTHKETRLLLVIHCILGWFSTFQVWLNPTKRVVGVENSDLYPHLWGYWRWSRMYSNPEESVWRNTEAYLHFPETGSLYHVDWLNGAIVSFLSHITGSLILGTNGMILIQWIVLGVGILGIAKVLNLKWWGALFLVLTLDGSMFIQRFALHSGVFERLNIGTILIYLACLITLKESRSIAWKPLLLGMSGFTLTLLGSWHYAMFLALASVALSIWILWSERSWKTCQNLGILAGGCGLIAYPISQRAQSSLDSSSIIEHSAQRLWDWHTPLEVLNDFNWWDLFWSRTQTSSGYDVLEESIFIGLLIPCLIIWGLWSGSISSRAKWLAGIAATFGLLSLGPTIFLTNNLSISSPLYYGFAATIPYFVTLEVPWEYSLMTLIFGGCSAALIINSLSIPKWIPISALLVQQGFALQSFIDWSEPNYPSNKSMTDLEKRKGAVLNFPLSTQSNSNKPNQSPHHEYLWWGIHHELPIAHGIQQNWMMKDEFWRAINRVSSTDVDLLKLEQYCNSSLCRSPKSLSSNLYQQGFRSFLLHRSFLSKQTEQKQMEMWTDLFGPPTITTPQVFIFAISN